MLPDGSLDGKIMRDLVTLLADAFPRRSDLEMLTRFALDQPLGDVSGEAENIPYLCLQLVTWCEKQRGDKLERLVRGAVRERSARDDLRALAKRLGISLQDVAMPPPAPAAEPPSPAISSKEREQLYLSISRLDPTRWAALLADFGLAAE